MEIRRYFGNFSAEQEEYLAAGQKEPKQAASQN